MYGFPFKSGEEVTLFFSELPEVEVGAHSAAEPTFARHWAPGISFHLGQKCSKLSLTSWESVLCYQGIWYLSEIVHI